MIDRQQDVLGRLMEVFEAAIDRIITDWTYPPLGLSVTVSDKVVELVVTGLLRERCELWQSIVDLCANYSDGTGMQIYGCEVCGLNEDWTIAFRLRGRQGLFVF